MSNPGGPGLDRSQMPALLAPRRDPAAAGSRIREHLNAHHGYVAFSGGKDRLGQAMATLCSPL
jgi:phosphoadenosine phosphosulfate reductase